MKLARRTFLQTSALLAATSALHPLRLRAAARKFASGVASGDPLQDRVILWTKVSLTKDAEPIGWEVAKDRAFRTLVQQGEVIAHKSKDGIVKFDCLGLEAGQTYYYRFTSNKDTSPIGRTKTLPRGRLDKLKLAVCSCANYNSGFFTAYRGIAEIKDLDGVIHLGDYIYEYGNNVYGSLATRGVRPQGECFTLDDYRARYAHYRTDLDLQRMHAAHPVIATWDDHEMANNGWREGAQNHSPDKEGNWSARQQAARQAYFEWLPLRPRGDKVYRQFTFGDLASLIMIDTRYDDRDKEWTLDKFLRKTKDGKPYFDKTAYKKAIFNPRRSIMSRAQQLWLKNALGAAQRNTHWSLIGNQIPFQPVYQGPIALDKTAPKLLQQFMGLLGLIKQSGLKKIPLSLDEWSGFPAAQQALVRTIEKANNPTLVLTGDTHNGWATFYGNKSGVELGTPGISSPGIEAYVPKKYLPALEKTFAKNNPAFFFRDMTQRGFMVLEINRERTKTSWIWADATKRGGKLRKGPSLITPHHNVAQSKLS